MKNPYRTMQQRQCRRWTERLRKWVQFLKRQMVNCIVWLLEVSEYAAIVRSTHVGCRGRRCAHCNGLVDMMIARKRSEVNNGEDDADNNATTGE